jgi:Ca2+-binding EF-hand superfamily protein
MDKDKIINENEETGKMKKEKRKYNLTSTGFRQRIEQNLDDNQNLVKKFKEEVHAQGINTVFEMEKTLNKIDVDNSGRIDPDEFSRLCSEQGLNLIPDEIKTLFTCFDPSRTGKIYYQDILNLISDELNDSRENLVNELFNNMKKNNIGNIDLKTMLCSFDKDKMKQEELEEYKDNFISHHDFYGKGKTDITYDEFFNFFEIISPYYSTDEDFEKFIKNSFNPNYEEKTVEKKEEKEEEIKEPTVLESIDKLRNEITKQGDIGVINLLKNFRNVDLAGSNGVDLEEFISVIQKIKKESKKDDKEINANNLSDKEIQNIFKMYDIEDKGIMEYRKFLNDLFKIKLMSESRKAHLRNIYDHLDFEHKQALDINELISLYKKPEQNSENIILPDLLETFIIFHNIIRGTRNPLVSLDDFLEYYSYINFLIPETKGDKLFIDFTAEGWRLYDKSFDERKNMIINKTGGLGLGKQKNREAMNKIVGSNKAPFGTDREKINYNLNEEEATIKYNVNKIEDIIGHLRYILFQRGPRGIMALKRTFMLLDENSDKKISFAEFEKMFKRYRFNLSQIEINNLFNYFDQDKSGFIDYSEFLKGITGELNNFRKNILRQVFQKLDKDETGFIKVKTLRESYDPKGHPLVRQGKLSEDEILGEFIDILEYHFNLLNEKNEENEDINEIKIDFEEFCEFYKTISVSIEEDKYFEIMVLSEWDIKKDGKSLYQKDWNLQDE